jgi:hypothetical protein
MPSALLWEALPAHLVANIIHFLDYTMQGRGKLVLRAKKDALLGLPRALRKRREIQKNRKVSRAELLRTMERGLLQPYRLGYHLRKFRGAAPAPE